MIVADTSALLAVVLDEAIASRCRAALLATNDIVMSAGTLAEALIVAMGRNVEGELGELVDGVGIVVVPVTSSSARRAAAAYRRWGKGFHPAGLNFGDCFAYELAASRGCALLYVGNDFSRTDITSAL